jgi:leader peptidase (prepilin peptidase)/N-methyltransferase
MAVSDLAAVEPRAADPTDPAPTGRRAPVVEVGIVVGGALVALTLVRFGAGGLGAAWSLAQILLVFVACFDVATRRIPNRMTLPAMGVVLVLRAAFATGTVPEALAAGAAGFAAFYLLAILTRGGFGMGDVKLAALLGLLLGKALLPTLLIGLVAGGVASAAVFAVRRDRRQVIAYGPYLCLGAVLGILALNPPPLV